MILKDQIWLALKNVPYPGYSRNIVSFGLVQQVSVHQGEVTVQLNMSHLAQETQQTIAEAIRESLLALPEVHQLRLQVGQPAQIPSQTQPTSSRPDNTNYVVAVGSGKGGVGKTTVAVNLAVVLAQRGLRVGLMDTDVYGPNVPRMLGIDRLPPAQKGKIIPAQVHGVQIVSVGFLVDPDTPVIWRGPITDKLIRQFLTDVAWGELDILIADLPPGTGDVVISLIQRTQPDGAVVVTTPQDVALDDARKAVGMFGQFETPVLGLVENMSYFICPNCHTQHDLFGHGGAQSLAGALNIPLLGEIPLEPQARAGADRGDPACCSPARRWARPCKMWQLKFGRIYKIPDQPRRTNLKASRRLKWPDAKITVSIRQGDYTYGSTTYNPQIYRRKDGGRDCSGRLPRRRGL